ncbi:MAG: ATP-binding protein [Methylocystis sp.]|nr:ATP-binding protein [Methylocystis sp.]MCA3590483.1 ATP-binding protein [Methylocystis sp.]
MTRLSDIVEIDRRFARSARIDADLNGTPPLIGYVLQASVAKALMALALSQSEHRQGAFTWTGPYGGGKSSAALLVANLVAGQGENRAIARRISSKELTAAYAKAFPEADGPWKVIAVTGSRVALRETVTNAAAITFGWTDQQRTEAGISDAALISSIKRAGSSRSSGTLIVLDELGKLLEHEARGGGDIHLLQDLAEHATRSKGRLVIIGILHQGFDQYAARAARGARQEWAKVQGRFHDIGFLSGADETVALLGRAITSPAPPAAFQNVAKATAQAIAKRRPTEVDSLSRALAATWPLNPVTALLLGPVSRARFAQNERSVFGFLSSAEPAGFQEFLGTTDEGAMTYGPDRLWDYLASNFGMALAGGHESGRFSLAFEAIERAGAKGSPAHVALTKTAATLEFFRNGSGLALADDFLALSLPGLDDAERGRIIADLLEWAILIKQPRLGGYALFAGSDFDLEEAIARTTTPVDAAVLEGLPQRVGFGFATAKRHYFQTGALRTFEISVLLIGAEDAPDDVAASITARAGRGSGQLALVLGDESIEQSAVEAICKSAAEAMKKSGNVVALGAAANGYALRDSAAELAAVERVLHDHPQLEGDRIARRELAARHSSCVDRLHRALETSLDEAKWWLAPNPSKPMRETLPIVASALADAGYPNAPALKSELLQRDRPSSNSMAALRDLCHAMVSRGDQANLGNTGFPAELGLYLTVIKPFGLHRAEPDGRFGFCDPSAEGPGKSLRPAWQVLEEAGAAGLGEVFRIWSAPPFGIKAGVMPALALAYMLANRETVAVYANGVFQTGIDDVTVDRLLQRPADFKFRTIDRSVREAAFLGGLAALIDVQDASTSLPVAQALFQRFEALPAHAARTTRVSVMAQAVRRAVLKSRDPEALLFDALPEALGDDLSAESVHNALLECEATYPSLLAEMRQAIAKALGVAPTTFAGLTERAASIKGLTNDYAFEAFADRVAALEGDGDLEGALSVLLHRPAHGWSDRDREQALTEIARYGRRFRELEALAVVRDRRSNTETLALVVGLDPLTPPLLRSFELTDGEKKAAAGLADRVLKVLGTDPEGSRLQLAALARAIAALAADSDVEAA